MYVKKMRIDYFKKIIILSAVLTIVNALFAHHTTIALVLALIETAVFVYYLVFKSVSEFTLVFLLITSLSLENPGFALGDRGAILYSVYNLPILKTYFLLLILVFADFKVFLSIINLLKSEYKNIPLCKFSRYFITMCVIGVFMTIITLLVNDNQIFSHKDMWPYIARDIYPTFHTCSILMFLVHSFYASKFFKNKIKEYLLGMLVGVTIGSIVLILCQNFYSVGYDIYYLTCPLIFFFAPGLILFYFEKEHGYLYLISGLISLVIQIKFTLGIAGAWWLYILVVLFAFVRRMFSIKRKTLSVKRILIWSGVILIVIVVALDGIKLISNEHVQYKLQTLKAMLSRNSSIHDWYMSLGGSIQTRIEEIVNIVTELVKKPWFLLFGKGYGGTVLKHWGISNWNVSGSTFADVQIYYETYSSFHMGFAEVMINFGLLGIILTVKVIKDLVIESVKGNGNTWIIMGSFWFLLFYSCYYSFIVGLVWMCYGLYLRSEQEKGSVHATKC